MVIDCANFHKTPEVLAVLKDIGTTVCMVPPGCTGHLQPLDTHINKTFKSLYMNYHEDITYNKEHEEWSDSLKWDKSKKRIVTTQAVAKAWEQLCTEKRFIELVKRSFVDTGISVAADGSEDHLIHIKDWNGEIGDFTQRNMEIEKYQNRLYTTVEEAEELEIAEEGVVQRDYRLMTHSQLNKRLEQKNKSGKKSLKKAEKARVLEEHDAKMEAVQAGGSM